MKTETGKIYLPKSKEQFTYDANGNMTGDGRWQYDWDAQNRLIRATDLSVRPSVFYEYEYDGFSRRISKKKSVGTAYWNSTPISTRHFFYDGWNLIAETEKTEPATTFTPVAKYSWGIDLSGSLTGAGGVGGLLFAEFYLAANWSPAIPAYDGSGNVRVLADAMNGVAKAEYEYGPFGEVQRTGGVLAESNCFRWSTKYTDEESELVYYGYRYFKATAGRWLSRDPIAEKGGINLSSFAFNNSMDFVDTDGRQAILIRNPRLAEVDPRFRSPGKINDDINKSYKWHHTRHEAAVTICCCDPEEAFSVIKQHLRSFDLFNSANTGATVYVLEGALFFEQGTFDKVLMDLGHVTIGVNTSFGGDRDRFEVQAITDEFHPLIGKRRWGADLLESDANCPRIRIWTETYEVANNFNGLAAERGAKLADRMWTAYLNENAESVSCGGIVSPARMTINETLKYEQPHPWR